MLWFQLTKVALRRPC